MSVIAQMREVCQQRKRNAKGKMVWAGHWFNTLFVRHFSIYITWLFVKMGVSANSTTFLVIPLGLAGVALCVPGVLWINILGFFLLILAEVFDCVDGEIARWMKKSSLRGVYLDLVSHILCNAPLTTLCALHLYVLTGRLKYLILAFVAYAATQCYIGLVEVYQHVRSEISSCEAAESGKIASSASILQKPSSRAFAALSFAKKALYIFTDVSVIRLTSFASILLSYVRIMEPLIFFAWFFAVFGMCLVIAEIASKFFYRVPHMQHVKKV